MDDGGGFAHARLADFLAPLLRTDPRPVVIVTGADHRVDWWNEAAAGLTGWRNGQPLAQQPAVEVLGDDVHLHVPPTSHHARLTPAGGHAVLVFPAPPPRDQLTGLPLRQEFRERVAELARMRGSVSVFLVDIDRFKSVNDTLGHRRGDELIRAFAQRLTARGATPARLGGDEFGLCAALDAPAAAALAADLSEAVCGRYEWPGSHRLEITASIGHTTAEGASPVEDVLEQADIALYAAKRAGRHRVMGYGPALRQSHASLRESEGRLRRALDESRVVVHYQPITSLADGRTVAFEALARLDDAHQVVGTAGFLPVAEATGLIAEVDQQVLSRIVADLGAGEHTAAGRTLGRVGTVAVNLSEQTLRSPLVAEHLAELLREHEVAPGRLVLEVPERVLLSADSAARHTIARLADIGCELAVTAFGSLVDELSSLARNPFRHLRLGRQWTARLATDGAARATFATLADLGHSLGMLVTAEGIETEEELHQARALGADRAHGRLLGPPCERSTGLRHTA